MPKFVVERNIPNAGQMTTVELAALSRTSCNVLHTMGPEIHWLESFVTDNKVYCIYIAPDEETIREHARLGGFPANSIAMVRTIVDPTFAD